MTDARQVMEDVRAHLDDPDVADAIGNILGSPFQVGRLADIVAHAVNNTALHYRARGTPLSVDTLDAAATDAIRYVGGDKAMLPERDIEAMGEIAFLSLCLLLRGEELEEPRLTFGAGVAPEPVVYDA